MSALSNDPVAVKCLPDADAFSVAGPALRRELQYTFPSDLERPRVFEAVERDTRAMMSVRRSHFGYDLWVVDAATISGAPPPRMFERLFGAVSRYALSAQEGSCVMLAVGRDASQFPALGFSELSNHDGNTSYIKSLRGEFQFGAGGGLPPKVRSIEVEVRSLTEAEIVKGSRIAASIWGDATGDAYLKDNLAYRSNGALVCGAFLSSGELAGVGTIAACLPDSKVWAMTWGVVIEELQKIGIGSAISQYRFEHAKRIAGPCSVLVVTDKESHSLRNGFSEIARFSDKLGKRLLLKTL